MPRSYILFQMICRIYFLSSIDIDKVDAYGYTALDLIYEFSDPSEAIEVGFVVLF